MPGEPWDPAERDRRYARWERRRWRERFLRTTPENKAPTDFQLP